ncbi:MAG: carboxypeptidase-like regulatory domain-containing protein, partial [bacterium]
RVARAEVDITASAQKDLRLALPSRSDAVRALCGSPSPPNTSILLGRLADTVRGARSPSGMRVSGSWIGNVSIMNAGARWQKDSESIDLDDKGRFSLCGVPRGRAFELALHSANDRVADTLITIAPKADVQQLVWRVNLDAITTVAAKGPARLDGRVKEDGNGKPLRDADIWLPSLDRRTKTDGSGAFAFDRIPPGYQVVTVRLPGFGTRIDTVRLTASRTTTREYALEAASLDTAHVVAAAVPYASPGLRGFEARRSMRSAGFFVSEAELRQHESEQLVNVIMARASGLRQLSSDNGGTYLASSIKLCRGRAFSASASCLPCYVTTYLDGVLTYNLDIVADRMEPTDFGRLSIRDLAGIEVYPREGTAPSPYTAARLGCGTVLVWMRER